MSLKFLQLWTEEKKKNTNRGNKQNIKFKVKIGHVIGICSALIFWILSKHTLYIASIYSELYFPNEKIIVFTLHCLLDFKGRCWRVEKQTSEQQKKNPNIPRIFNKTELIFMAFTLRKNTGRT